MEELLKASARLMEWRKAPVKFVKEAFRVEPDSWQLEVLESLSSKERKADRISMQACAGPGKTAVLAWAAWWFLLTQGDEGEHPKGAALSVTADNLRDNLWSEMAKWRSKSEFLTHAFDLNADQVYAKDHPKTWFLSARSFPKSASTEEMGKTLSGLHGKYLLYVIDESGTINPAVLRAAEQGLATGGGGFGKILQAGNPITRDGMLHEAATVQRHLWKVIRITGDPDDPKRSHRIDLDWAREQIKLYGRDNAWVQAYILGQFPEGGMNTLLSVEMVQKAMSREYKDEDYKWAQKRLGVDAARFGDDPWVIFPRQGLVAYPYEVIRNPRTQEIAAKVSSWKMSWGSELEFFDDTGGYAAGAIDALIQAGHAPIPVNFSGKADDPRYFNKRSEMWFRMKEWVERGGKLPPDDQLARELTVPTYTFQNGKFRLEEKDQIKKRLGFSPNAGDSLALSFALPERPGELKGLEGVLPSGVKASSGKAEFEYDPLKNA